MWSECVCAYRDLVNPSSHIYHPPIQIQLFMNYCLPPSLVSSSLALVAIKVDWLIIILNMTLVLPSSHEYCSKVVCSSMTSSAVCCFPTSVPGHVPGDGRVTSAEHVDFEVAAATANIPSPYASWSSTIVDSSALDFLDSVVVNSNEQSSNVPTAGEPGCIFTRYY